MRPQSLYSYFDSKSAIYDAMYAEGARRFLDGQQDLEFVGDMRTDIETIGRYFVGFCTEDPVRYQLLFQRTIPGFEPSPESFAISVQSLELIGARLISLGIDDPRDLDLFTAIGTGLIDQQISNDPGGDRWTRLLDDAIDMEMLQRVLDPTGKVQFFEAVAANFDGVFELLRAVATMVLEKLAQKA